MAKSYSVWIIALLILATILRLYAIDEPFLDTHSWRQIDGAMIARNFFESNSTILSPELDYTYGNGYIMALEPQITPYLISQVYRFTGIHHWSARIVPILFSILAIFFFYKLIFALTKNIRLALVSAFVYSILPINIFISRSILPEALIMLLSNITLFFFVTYHQDKGKKNIYYILFIIFLSLFILVKLYTAYLLIAIILFIFMTNKTWKQQKQDLLKLACYLALPLIIISFVYILININSTRDSIPFGFDFVDRGTGVNYWFSLDDFLSYDIHKEMLGRLVMIVATPPGIILAILGISTTMKFPLMRYYLYSLMLFLLILWGSNYAHKYNLIHFTPIASLLIGSGILRISKTIQRYNILSKLCIIGLCILLLFASVINAQDLYWQNQYIKDASERFNELSLGEDIVMFFPHRGTMGQYLYYINTKGFIVPYGVKFDKEWYSKQMRENEIEIVVFLRKSWADWNFDKVEDITDETLAKNYIEGDQIEFDFNFSIVEKEDHSIIFRRDE